MSVVNRALAQGIQHRDLGLSNLERVEVSPRKARPAWLWAMFGFGVSLALGGWSISLPPVPTLPDVSEARRMPIAPSPTQKTSDQALPLYLAPSQPILLAAAPALLPSAPLDSLSLPVPNPVSNPVPNTAAVASARQAAPLREPVAEPVMLVEQVELTSEQLAAKARQSAQKALDNNDFQAAVNGYTQALRYTPNDETIRQKLAALYYGQGDGRKAFDLMQAGIELNPEGEVLRLALAKLLAKEQQESAALAPLIYLPAEPSSEYLALRAGLAHKTKQDPIARQSYQQLTLQEPNNARWWLGLAIQQERALEWSAAQYAYQQALHKVGLSSQSHAFIEQRLTVLRSLEEISRGN
ncbi:tetratricopeptide repeat protein [Vibrio sp. HDW18]|uniref:tetratricopeptide repeat protein n=1 Tax=Vibrio sp. HDW18 TaxID=2714948 RepID=UPI00140AF880|nr:tetratricopeptide repeat protein [Vibrio sp. HDW18]QIL85229.1 tetratricopeptide repeat protein [Vibrio sp. HDW18]